MRGTSRRGPQNWNMRSSSPPIILGRSPRLRHQPGTISYSMHLQLDLAGDHRRDGTQRMQENRNRKCPRSGTSNCFPYFAQAQLETPHDYVVLCVLVEIHNQPGTAWRCALLTSQCLAEGETSDTMVSRPDLVHLDRAGQESGTDLHRLNLPDGLYTGIWWYARFPSQSLRGGCKCRQPCNSANSIRKAWTAGVAEVIRAVKVDRRPALELQNQFL